MVIILGKTGSTHTERMMSQTIVNAFNKKYKGDETAKNDGRDHIWWSFRQLKK